MNSFDKLLFLALIISVILLLIIYFYSNKQQLTGYINENGISNYNKQLLDLVLMQNKSIHVLESALQKCSNLPHSPTKIATNDATPKINVAVNDIRPNMLQTKFEQECENRYGLHLADLWKGERQIWCNDESGLSTLVCYPYHQQHKRLDGRGPDMFCEATNFLVDFSKVCILHQL